MKNLPFFPTSPKTLNASGLVLWLGWICVTLLSSRFAYGTPASERPIVVIVCLFLGMSGVYFFAVRTVLKASIQNSHWTSILLFAIAMRVVALFSTPIQELDYYRYLWDGATVLQGVSPYEYSPQQVLQSNAAAGTLADDLQRLISLRNRSPQTATILARVHYGELPSIYPPVSLAVFTIAAAMTPDFASVETAIVVMKAWMVLFDIGIIFLLANLLKTLQMPVCWCIAYAWCPLVIKEFANSGHLDSITVFFMTASALFLVKAVFDRSSCDSAQQKLVKNRVLFSGLFLGLAIGAKLFPVVVIPLFLVTFLRKHGVANASRFLATVSAVTLLTCWPVVSSIIFSDENPKVERTDTLVTANELPNFEEDQRLAGLPPIPINPGQKIVTPPVETNPVEPIESTKPQPPQRSLKVFLTRWKMNDFIFLIVESNIAPEREQRPSIWFTFFPNSWRTQFVMSVSRFTGWSLENVPFLLARSLLSAIFLLLAIWLSWQATKTTDARDWLGYLFLTLAWFWATSPTMNPWYWTWALPFVIFAKSRSWLLVSGFVFFYYLRFWFGHQWDAQTVWGTPYMGEDFFHYVFVWLEHMPWMLALAFEYRCRIGRHAQGGATSTYLPFGPAKRTSS